MIRIRYHRTENPSLFVSGPIFTGRTEVIVHLLKDEKTLRIFDGNTMVHEENAKSMHALKKAAKRALKALGVGFDDEVRGKAPLDKPVLSNEELLSKLEK